MDPQAFPPEGVHDCPKLVTFFPPSSISSSSTVTLDGTLLDFPSKSDNNGHAEDENDDDGGEGLELSLGLCTGGKKEKEKEKEREREKSAMPGLIRGRSASFLPVSAMDDGNPNIWNKGSPLCRSASLSFSKAASSSSPPSWVLSYDGSGSLLHHHPYQEKNSVASAAAVAVSTPPLVRHFSCGDIQQKLKERDDEQQRQRRLEARKRRKILMEEKQMKRAKKERPSMTPLSSSLSISRKNSNAEICSRNLEADIAGSERRSIHEKKKNLTVEERESALVNQTKGSLQEDRDNGSSAEGSELHQGELNPGDLNNDELNHSELNRCELNQGESAVSDTSGSTSHVTSPSASVSVPVLPNPSRVLPSLTWQMAAQPPCLQDAHTTTNANTHTHAQVISSFRPPFPPPPPSGSIPWLSPMRPPLPMVSTRVSNQPDAYGSAKDSESWGSRDCSDEKIGAGIVEGAELTRAAGNPSLADKPPFLHRTSSDCAEEASLDERSTTNTIPSPLLRHRSLPVKPRPQTWKKGKLEPWSNLTSHATTISSSRIVKEEEGKKGIKRSNSVGEAVLRETIVEQRGSTSIGGGVVSGAELPWVSTTGPGPDGKTVNGVMYILNRSQVRIVCNCHNSHMTPSEFVQHAGGTDLSNPERSIFVNPFPYATQVAPPPVS